jgi:hypothetical protein
VLLKLEPSNINLRIIVGGEELPLALSAMESLSIPHARLAVVLAFLVCVLGCKLKAGHHLLSFKLRFLAHNFFFEISFQPLKKVEKRSDPFSSSTGPATRCLELPRQISPVTCMALEAAFIAA